MVATVVATVVVEGLVVVAGTLVALGTVVGTYTHLCSIPNCHAS